MPSLTIRPSLPDDREWIERAMRTEWSAEIVAVHGTIYRPAELPGFVAVLGRKTTGLLTYRFEGGACEIVTLNSWQPGRGVGTALIEAVTRTVVGEGCRRLWLVTTNDNTSALRFYQLRGFVLAAVHINAVAWDRQLKPEIPLTGNDGIPIRDELELEMLL